jgi:hypothetical protein
MYYNINKFWLPNMVGKYHLSVREKLQSPCYLN